MGGFFDTATGGSGGSNFTVDDNTSVPTSDAQGIYLLTGDISPGALSANHGSVQFGGEFKLQQNALTSTCTADIEVYPTGSYRTDCTGGIYERCGDFSNSATIGEAITFYINGAIYYDGTNTNVVFTSYCEYAINTNLNVLINSLSLGNAITAVDWSVENTLLVRVFSSPGALGFPYANNGSLGIRAGGLTSSYVYYTAGS